jgi:hypothetical protein
MYLGFLDSRMGPDEARRESGYEDNRQESIVFMAPYA